MFSLVFRETAKKIGRNRKNRLILILSTLGIFTYLLLYLPSADSITTLDTEKLMLEMEAEQGTKESRLAEGNISVNNFTGVDTYSLAKDAFEDHFSFHTALVDGDMQRLAQLKANGLPMFTVEAMNDHLMETYNGNIQMPPGMFEAGTHLAPSEYTLLTEALPLMTRNGDPEIYWNTNPVPLESELSFGGTEEVLPEEEEAKVMVDILENDMIVTEYPITLKKE